MKKSTLAVYNAKKELVETIMSLRTVSGPDTVTNEIIEAEGRKLGLSRASSRNAWDSYRLKGTVDARFTKDGTKQASIAQIKASKKYMKSINAKPSTKTTKEKATIILDYMQDKTTIKSVCNKYSISPDQLFTWLEEISKTGKLDGHQILSNNYRKYLSTDIISSVKSNKGDNYKKMLFKVMKDYLMKI